MKHFVVVNEWASEYECGSNVLGVAHSLEEAKEIFNTNVAEEVEYASIHEYTIYDHCETVFDAGDDSGYIGNHTRLYIQMV